MHRIVRARYGAESGVDILSLAASAFLLALVLGEYWWTMNHANPIIALSLSLLIAAYLAIRRLIRLRNPASCSPAIRSNVVRGLPAFASLLALAVGLSPYRVALPLVGASVSRVVLVLGSCLVVLYYEPLLRRAATQHRVITLVFMAGVAVSFSGYVWSDNLRAKWSIIDDHEIISAVSDSRRMALSQIPQRVLQTEVGQYGEAVRYRPSYYTLRYVEAALWGNAPGLWHLAHLAMFAFSVTALWWVLGRAVGIAYGALVTLVVLTDTYWIDIWTRLGPGEIYATVGLALYSLGFSRRALSLRCGASTSPGWRALDWIIILIGAIIAVGSKENFLLLAPATAVLAVADRRSGRLLPGVATLTVVAYSAAIAVSVYLGTSRLGSDVYRQDVTLANRLDIALHSGLPILKSVQLWDVLLGILIIGVAVRACRGERYARLYLKTLSRALFALTVLMAVYVSQVVFYSGNWPTNSRYDFPGQLAVIIMWLVVAMLAIDVTRIVGVQSGILRYLKLGLALGLVLMILTRGYQPLRDASAINAAQTTAFTNHVLAVAKEASLEPDKPLVFESYGVVTDFEPVISAAQFLRAFGVKNPLFLRLHVDAESFRDSSFNYALASALRSISAEGGQEFRPLAAFNDSDGSCMSLGFSGSGPSNCRSLGRLWPY